MTELEHSIKEHVAMHAALQAKLALLMTIVRIGSLTATKLLAEFGDLK